MSVLERLRSLDPTIVGLTLTLLVVGLLLLFSATVAVGVQRAGDSLFFVKNQLIKGVIPGTFAFLLAALIDYRTWRTWALGALIISIGLLLLVYVPGVGVILNGARGWIRIAGLQFQPSEIVKVSFIVYLAAWLASRKADEVHKLETGLIPFLFALGSVMFLLIMQPDTGSMMVLVGTSLTMYFLSGAPVSWFVLLCALGSGLLALLIKISPYRAARFMVFLRPELDPKGIGYHINQAVLAIGSGGWLGLGYGQSRQKYLYLPEVESDSIVAVVAEELGFLAICLLLALFGALIWRCFTIAREAKDPFGTYLAAGVGMMLVVQCVMNIGSMTGLLPITGVTLPFISHGGTAMVMIMGCMGLIAGIPSRQSTRSSLRPRL
ncbi:putative lipid II flippase FtsW [Patescibacteria group bacterium]|nr:putative lipid II flippase FtsW [Patescibacteria group bacterium]